MDEKRQPTVLITGCTSGIGRATAMRLAAGRWRVLAGYRKAADRESLALLPGVTPVEIDVTSDEQAAAAAVRAAEHFPDGLDALINNAGYAYPAALEFTDAATLMTLLDVNTVGPLRMIRALLPALRQRRGRIVNVSSMNGTVALPMVGGYSASKFALEALCDTLRVELRPWGIQVISIRPGQVQTAIFDKARTELESGVAKIPETLRGPYERLYWSASRFNERGAKHAGDADDVALVIAKALRVRRPRARYIVGWDARGLHLAKRWLPTRLFDRALARATGMLKKG